MKVKRRVALVTITVVGRDITDQADSWAAAKTINEQFKAIWGK